MAFSREPKQKTVNVEVNADELKDVFEKLEKILGAIQEETKQLNAAGEKAKKYTQDLNKALDRARAAKLGVKGW